SYTDKSTWAYDIDPKTNFAKVDETMQDPRCVFQIMKKFYARYTPAMVSSICGCTPEDFEKAAEIITSTYLPNKVGTIMYALGWTHHSFSVQLIHAAAMLQLLLGNVGMPGGGVNALRGHSNIQGGTDCGMAYHNIPGYIAIQKADHAKLSDYLAAVCPKPLRPGVMNFMANYDRFVVSQFKAYYGKNATADNEFGFNLHPKLPVGAAPGTYQNWSWAYMFDHMYEGQMDGLFSFGMNPVCNGPHSRKAIAALSKLKWLVVAENFETETASFWKPEVLWLNDGKPQDVQTEVFLLPAPTSPKRTDPSPTPPVGLPGSTKPSIHPGRQSLIRRSLPASSSRFANCTRRKAASILIPSRPSTGGTPVQPSLRSKRSRKRSTAGRSPTLWTTRTRRSSPSRLAISSESSSTPAPTAPP